jgi:hypothetical protein
MSLPCTQSVALDSERRCITVNVGLASASLLEQVRRTAMERTEQVDAIRGKTVRLTWTKGPTKGKTHEHVFHTDGTVEWYDADSGPGASSRERPRYAALQAADQVYAVSYLAPTSGYTLTVVLNVKSHKMVGFASSAKDWQPVEGTFEFVR